MRRPDLDSPCSTLDGDENATNQILDSRLFTAAHAAGRSAVVSTEAPVKTGNRARIGLKSWCGIFFSTNRADGQRGHTKAETWLVRLRALIVALAVAQTNRQPLRGEEGKRQPSGSFCFTMAAVFFLLSAFPEWTGNLPQKGDGGGLLFPVSFVALFSC